MRVVIAEDSLLVREGVVSLLNAADDVEVVHACSDLDALLQAVDEHTPDLVLTDIRMPPTQSDEGVRAASMLRGTHTDLGVVVLSQFVDPEYVLEVFRAGTGGRGYVVKDRIHEVGHLVKAITTVAAGGSFIDDAAVEVLIAARRQAIDSPLDQLSPRELDVLKQIATGQNNTNVAASLHISVHAVEKHTSSIFAKLGLSENDEINRRVMAVLLFLSSDPPRP